jgi:hypothetical protein
MRSAPILVALAVLTAPHRTAVAQAHEHAPPRAGARPRSDTAFRALQDRGARVMGVDQYTSSHQFEALPDGGRIELVRDVDDTTGVRAIREHLRAVAGQFAAGDFSASATVHARAVPGTAVMRARRHSIHYEFRPLPRGGEVRITARDPRTVRAIHEFLAFQRADHRTGEK